MEIRDLEPKQILSGRPNKRLHKLARSARAVFAFPYIHERPQFRTTDMTNGTPRRA